MYVSQLALLKRSELQPTAQYSVSLFLLPSSSVPPFPHPFCPPPPPSLFCHFYSPPLFPSSLCVSSRSLPTLSSPPPFPHTLLSSFSLFSLSLPSLPLLPHSPLPLLSLSPHPSCVQSANSFLTKFHDKRNETGLPTSDFAGITFDAVYAAALALNVSIPILESNFSLKLENFEFGNVNLAMKFAAVVRQSLADLNFTGVSVSSDKFNYSN